MSGAKHAHAFIAFLNCEAKNNEERAKNLRDTANAIEAKSFSQTRKRKRGDAKPKKALSAYSLFVQENIEQFKKSHSDVPATEVVAIMARQWMSTSEEEKNIWKFRAEQMDLEPAPLQEASDLEEETDDPNNGKKRAALKKPPRKSGHSAEV